MAEINALLGKGSEFEGKLTFEGTVRIDGRFVGEILSDGRLIVGEGADVQAEIRVGSVEVYGDVTGNIFANEGVELYAPAALRGNITSPALHIDKGVFFEGACQMMSQAAPAARASQAVQPAYAPAPAAAVARREPALPAARSTDDVTAATRAISGLYAAENAGSRGGPELKHSF